MKKARIIFFLQHMLCGGVENAVIALSQKLVDQGNDVTIALIRKHGSFVERIPKQVKLIEIPMAEKIRELIPVGGSKLAMRECIDHRNYSLAIRMLLNRFVRDREFAELAVPLEKIPELSGVYDYAVNFHMHSPFLVWYLSERVQAKTKYTWIHNDFSTTGYHVSNLEKYLNCSNGFFGVSNQLVNEFKAIFPQWADRVDVIYNIVPYKKILQLAEEPCRDFEQYPASKIKILSVGRLENQKGYDYTIGVGEKLKQSGYDFIWYILGEGSERESLERLVKQKGLQEYMIFPGIKMNPYPYYKNCDLYVQTSRHEGYVTAVTEANIFDKPIVCTDVAGAREQIIDGENGYVAQLDVDDVFNKIQKMLNNHSMVSFRAIEKLKDNDAKSAALFNQ